LSAEKLVPGGWLLVEIGPSTAAAAETVVAAQATLSLEPTLKDMAALPRIVQARRRG
jgi:methylase of polypeptide subunit release factors